jgi:transcriptional regulator with XRE-family HTH domain
VFLCAVEEAPRVVQTCQCDPETYQSNPKGLAAGTPACQSALVEEPSFEDKLQTVRAARAALDMTREEFAEKLGSSFTTVGRWERGHSFPADDHFVEMARLLYPVDRDLAEQAASMARATLVSLGIEQVPPATPPAAPAPRPSPPARELTDIIVCAAAEACRGTPADLRAPLLAAFSKARQLGLDYGEIEASLEARLASGPTPATAPTGEPLVDASAKKRS